jgi:hypothetical protein
MKLFIPLLALTALLLTACQDDSQTASDTAVTPGENPAGLKAYIDPATGKLARPPAEELQRQNLQTNTMEVRKQEQPVMIPLEGGGYRAPLDGRFQIESTATVQPDGSLTIEESTDDQQ